jgi:hypothetical protein
MGRTGWKGDMKAIGRDNALRVMPRLSNPRSV